MESVAPLPPLNAQLKLSHSASPFAVPSAVSSRCSNAARPARSTQNMVSRNPHASCWWLQEKMMSRTSGVPVPKLSSLNELHDRLQELEKEMKEHSTSYKQLLAQRKELSEHLQVPVTTAPCNPGPRDHPVTVPVTSLAVPTGPAKRLQVVWPGEQ
eukprot:1246135-Rhodomonas_salina.1